MHSSFHSAVRRSGYRWRKSKRCVDDVTRADDALMLKVSAQVLQALQLPAQNELIYRLSQVASRRNVAFEHGDDSPRTISSIGHRLDDIERRLDLQQDTVDHLYDLTDEHTDALDCIDQFGYSLFKRQEPMFDCSIQYKLGDMHGHVDSCPQSGDVTPRCDMMFHVEAAIIIQKWYRSFSVRRSLSLRRSQDVVRNEAATRIQSSVRVCLARRRMKILREEFHAKDDGVRPLQDEIDNGLGTSLFWVRDEDVMSLVDLPQYHVTDPWVRIRTNVRLKIKWLVDDHGEVAIRTHVLMAQLALVGLPNAANLGEVLKTRCFATRFVHDAARPHRDYVVLSKSA